MSDWKLRDGVLGRVDEDYRRQEAEAWDGVDMYNDFILDEDEHLTGVILRASLDELERMLKRLPQQGRYIQWRAEVSEQIRLLKRGDGQSK